MQLLHTDGAQMEQRHPTQTTKLPVYVMKVTNRVPIEQVCESIIYGTVSKHLIYQGGARKTIS